MGVKEILSSSPRLVFALALILLLCTGISKGIANQVRVITYWLSF